jgi:DNA-binding MarR family transcriptional regulator
MQATSVTPAAATEASAPRGGASAKGRTRLTRDMYALLSYLMREATVGTLNTVAELDISFTQMKALCALDADGEDRSVKALAESMRVSLPAMSRAVDGLFERGFVQREEDPVDRRMKRVRLTDAGRSVPRLLNETRLSALTDFIGTLDEDEAEQLEHALALIVRRGDIAAHRPATTRGAR